MSLFARLCANKVSENRPVHGRAGRFEIESRWNLGGEAAVGEAETAFRRSVQLSRDVLN